MVARQKQILTTLKPINHFENSNQENSINELSETFGGDIITPKYVPFWQRLLVRKTTLISKQQKTTPIPTILTASRKKLVNWSIEEEDDKYGNFEDGEIPEAEIEEEEWLQTSTEKLTTIKEKK